MISLAMSRILGATILALALLTATLAGACGGQRNENASSPAGDMAATTDVSVKVASPSLETYVLPVQSFNPVFTVFGDLVIYGEVVNVHSVPVAAITVTVSTYSHDGQLIGGANAYALQSVVPAGDRGTFIAWLPRHLTDDPVSFQITAHATQSSAPTTGLAIVTRSSRPTSSGALHIEGIVHNNSANSYSQVQVIVTVYDAASEILIAQRRTLDIDELKPRQIATYDIVIEGGAYLPVGSYRVQVQGQPAQ